MIIHHLHITSTEVLVHFPDYLYNYDYDILINRSGMTWISSDKTYTYKHYAGMMSLVITYYYDTEKVAGSRYYLEEDYAGELSLIGGFLNPIVPGWGNMMLPNGCGIRCKEGYWWYDIYLWAGSRSYLYKVAMAGAGYYPVISGGYLGAPTSFVAELNSGIVTTYVTRASDSTIHAGSRC